MCTGTYDNGKRPPLLDHTDINQDKCGLRCVCISSPSFLHYPNIHRNWLPLWGYQLLHLPHSCSFQRRRTHTIMNRGLETCLRLESGELYIYIFLFYFFFQIDDAFYDNNRRAKKGVEGRGRNALGMFCFHSFHFFCYIKWTFISTTRVCIQNDKPLRTANNAMSSPWAPSTSAATSQQKHGLKPHGHPTNTKMTTAPPLSTPTMMRKGARDATGNFYLFHLFFLFKLY
jgi:hypothetical protein